MTDREDFLTFAGPNVSSTDHLMPGGRVIGTKIVDAEGNYVLQSANYKMADLIIAAVNAFMAVAAPMTNVTVFGRVDAPGGVVWRTFDHRPDEVWVGYPEMYDCFFRSTNYKTSAALRADENLSASRAYVNLEGLDFND